MRVPFNYVWSVHGNSVTNKVKLKVAGIVAMPEALSNLQCCFGGILWSQFIGHDLEIKTDGDVVIITGIYNT